MTLTILASGSRGNCYLLSNLDKILLIECGISFKEIEKALNYDISNVVGCIVSHCHSDHVKCAKEIQNACIDIYGNQETISYINFGYSHHLKVLQEKQKVDIGGFAVTPFELPHNGVQNFGYIIEQEEMGRLLFMTDFEYCKYRFKNIQHMIIEANYDKQYVTQYDDSPNRDHIFKGHCEIGTTCKFIENNNDSLQNIILAHLSQANASPKDFTEQVQKVANCRIEIAHRGVSVNLNKEKEITT